MRAVIARIAEHAVNKIADLLLWHLTPSSWQDNYRGSCRNQNR
jgi:hypothetical protein